MKKLQQMLKTDREMAMVKSSKRENVEKEESNWAFILHKFHQVLP